MEDRRNLHKLLFFHKIVHGDCPSYLTDMVPHHVCETSRYPLRNNSNITTFQTRLDIFYKSFFPSTVREWNLLNQNLRNIHEYSEFKRQLLENSPQPNPIFYIGNRKTAIVHTRIRMKCSLLHAHLADRHIIDDASCQCGHLREDSLHYFFICNLYNRQRALLHQVVLQ